MFSCPVEELDVTANSALQALNCCNCKLKQLDLSKNTKLVFLDCHGNSLGSLNLSKNENLRFLSCHHCELTKLDLSKQASLEVLDCRNNKLTELVLSNNSNLQNTSTWTGVTDYEVSMTTALSPQELRKRYFAIAGRSKVGVRCNTNEGILNKYGGYSVVTEDGSNYIVVGNSESDVHGYGINMSYDYVTGYNGSAAAAQTMTVNITTPAHGMYVHPKTFCDEVYSGTLYLEYPATIPDGVQCYYATELTEDEELTTLTEVTGTIPAYTAVIVKSPAEPGYYAFNESAATPAAVLGNIIEGTINGQNVEPRTVLTLGHNRSDNAFGFWDFLGTHINPFRAYITKSSVPESAKDGFCFVFPEPQ